MCSVISAMINGQRSIALSVVHAPLYSKRLPYFFPTCLLAPSMHVWERVGGHSWSRDKPTPISLSCRTGLGESTASEITIQTSDHSSNTQTNNGTRMIQGGNRMDVPVRSGDMLLEHQVVNLCSQKFPVWTSHEWGRNIDMRKQIFCNRSLNMKSIVAIGFDMDYTLAQYKPETFETLAYNGTLKKLVYDLGYPPELLQWKFDWGYMVRGLVLDKKRGNILKMDRHKYVKVAYHGFNEMSREDRIATYGNTLLRESFDEPDYALIDTLFSLAEAYLFAQLVELKDGYPEKIPTGTDYAQMYRDVRAAVDLCHRDGTVKQAVASNPAKFIHEDQMIVPMLKMLRNSGRMTFLVTNSLWDYTHVVMNYLCGKCGVNGSTPRDDEWLDYFDVVITGSSKPGFFKDGNRSPLFEVDIRTGMLQNTDNGSPLPQIGGSGLSPRSLPQNGVRQGCRVFQGGNVGHLHRLLSIEASSQVLYVGDHIYGDILRSKKQLGWRTMLVVPELERELELLCESKDIRKEFRLLRQQRDCIEHRVQQLIWAFKFEESDGENQRKTSFEVEELQSQREKVRELHRQAQRECHQKFHKTWGQLMKTGYQNSRFAHQVERFACLYTSQVTNLCYYSPDKCYRTSEDFMPHEFDILGL
eukprot:Gb_02972 [translate_table: standard]